MLLQTFLQYKSHRNLVVSLQRKAKKEYFHQLISKSVPPSTLWNTLRSVCSLSKPSFNNWSVFDMDYTDIANNLNQHFISITSSQTALPPPPCIYSLSSNLSQRTHQGVNELEFTNQVIFTSICHVIARDRNIA